MEALVVIYRIGDGYTFTATDTIPVKAPTKAVLIDHIDLALAAYEPDRPAWFEVFGTSFEYRHFVEHAVRGSVSVDDDYFVVMPEILTVDEWIEAEARRTGVRRGGGPAVRVVGDAAGCLAQVSVPDRATSG